MKQVKPCPFECNANDCKDCGAYTYSHHTQTNEEWFCQLPTEEKAEALARGSCGLAVPYDADEFTVAEIKRRWGMWLKQPHKE